MVPEHAAADADALQIKRDRQVVQRAAHHPAQFIDQHQRPGIARLGRFQQRRRVGKPQGCEPARHGIAGHQPFHIAHIAATAQRQSVVGVADKHVPGVARVAVFAAQHMAVHTQAKTDARAPGQKAAVVQALQRAPAALGLQRGNAVVFQPQAVAEHRAQRRFKRRAGPIVGQAARRPGDAAAEVGRGQHDQAVLHHKRSA